MYRDNNDYKCPVHDFHTDPRFDECIMCHYLFAKWAEDWPDWWGGDPEKDNACHCDICESITNGV
jgi:hypothetical protein